MRGRSEIVGVGSFSQGYVRFDKYLPLAKYDLPPSIRGQGNLYSYSQLYAVICRHSKFILKMSLKLIFVILRESLCN